LSTSILLGEGCLPGKGNREVIVSSWWPHIRGLITQTLQDENHSTLRECDYSRVTSAILPFYFHVARHDVWIITPEFNYLEAYHPDYTVFFLENIGGLQIFSPRIVVEIKSKTGKSWGELLEQMWSQADAAKATNGRLWAIGQKGFEICFFTFDISKFNGQIPPYCTNFEPLNLRNLTEQNLINLGLKFEYASNPNGPNRFGIIKWRLDLPEHEEYIHDMFEYMRTHRP
jgi:hypothetical protein